MTARRVATGGDWIDRKHALSFTFEGKSYQGYAGDSLAAALLAQGQLVFSRSWKYHRPRGVLTSGFEEPAALVQLEAGKDSIANAKMPEVELYQGLHARSVNPWRNLHRLPVNRWFSRMLAAGFYYKTFMWPVRFWPWYEHWIRKAGGLGQAPLAPDEAHYVHQNIHCDVLVVGGGIAGLAAALSAGASGARVILVEQLPHLGGIAHRLHVQIDGMHATAWAKQAQAQLMALDNVRIIRRGVAFGYHDGNFVTVREGLTDHLPLNERQGFREKLWRVRAGQVVLATGATERPMLFLNNDLPGVMLASAMSDYLQRYGVLLGQKTVLTTTNDSAYGDALLLQQAGAKVQVVDIREQTGVLGQKAQAAGVKVHLGFAPIQAEGATHVTALVCKRIRSGQELDQDTQLRLDCDALGMAGGWNPLVHLHAHAAGKTAWSVDKLCFVPLEDQPDCFNIGAANAQFGVQESLMAASLAGAQAAKAQGFAASTAAFSVQGPQTLPPAAYWMAKALDQPNLRSKVFVDYQNDVSAADIALAVREGFTAIEHIKRYTVMGFGTDQGKLGNINGMALAAQTLGLPIDAVGTTTFRPNFVPISFGLFAGLEQGDLFDPIRTTSAHELHVAAGAAFEDVGQWRRPWYYPKGTEDIHAAVAREVLAVRQGVGLFDASTLGKIDIQGPDAVQLLNWVYTNAWDKLPIGRSRYGLMLDENGMVFDDGVSTRLGENHFFMTTTTGGAANVLQWLERWVQTEWPQLRVYMTSVTDQWATYALAGPKSRAVLAQCARDVDLSAAAFPFMHYRQASIVCAQGEHVPVRVMRISFSGELAYEINIPNHAAPAVWQTLLQAGAEYDITRYGTETMHVLRAEKGYIIVGQDTDGSVTPDDLGLQAMVSKTKDCLGKRSLSRSHTAGSGRKQLVGLFTQDPQVVLPEGAPLTEHSAVRPGAVTPMLGHVSSSYHSPTLQRSIALALVQDGRNRMGQTIYAALADGSMVATQVTKPVFYDPEGLRHKD